MSINLKDTTYLLNNGFIMVTKKGTAWRCGKGYRKDWSKLIGKEVILHGSSYTLTQRVKKNNKWYLVFTDGQNNYTELQSKALHNKKLAKDTIIEAVKRVIAGLLTAPKELIDILVEEINFMAHKSNEIVLANPANYTKKGTFRKNKQDKLIEEYKPWLCVAKQNNPFNYNEWQMKIHYVSDILMDLFFQYEVAEDNEIVYSKEYIKQYTKKVLKQLQLRYHPDRNKSANANDEFRFVQKKLGWINNELFKVA